MTVAREQAELVLLDALEQVGASGGDLDMKTPLGDLRLCGDEFEDLAADLKAELGIDVSVAELQTAEQLGDVVDLVLERTFK